MSDTAPPAAPTRAPWRLALALGLGVAAGCGGLAPPPATALDASRANVQLADLEHGRSLMLAKCGACHRAPMPSVHSAAEWPVSLDEMSTRARLDPPQRHLIQQYLVTMATR